MDFMSVLQVGSLPLDDLEEERRRLLEKQKLAEERSALMND